MRNNYKIVDGDNVFIKVINFPTPAECDVGGESMWVLQRDGGDNNGTGWLANEPAFCLVVEHGSLVRYKGGTDERKPHYEETIQLTTTRFMD